MEGSIFMTFKSNAAADTFADEMQVGDVLVPGLQTDFKEERVSIDIGSVSTAKYQTNSILIHLLLEHA